VRAFIPYNLHAGIAAYTENTALQTYIQAAYDSVVARGGGIVYFPPGGYHVTSRVVVSSGKTFLEGALGGHLGNVSKIINDNTAGGVAVFIGDVTESSLTTVHLHTVGLKRLSIIGNASSGDGVYIYNAGVLLEDVNTDSNGRDGIHISKWGYSSEFARVTMQNNLRHGFFSNDSLNATSFRNCKFLGHTNYSGAYIQSGTWGSNSVTFDTCDFEGNKYGITFEADFGMKDITVSNTNFEGNTDNAIRQVGAANFDSFKLFGNTHSAVTEGVVLATARNAVSVGGYYSGAGIANSGSDPMLMLNPFTDTGTFTGVRTITTSTSFASSATPNGSIALTGSGMHNFYVRDNGSWKPVKLISMSSTELSATGASYTDNVSYASANSFYRNLLDNTLTALTIGVLTDGMGAGTEVTYIFLNGNCTAGGSITFPATHKIASAVVIPTLYTYTTIKFTADGNGSWIETSRVVNVAL